MIGRDGRAARAALAFLGLAGAAALAAVLLACGAETHEPGATDVATVSVVDRLAASDDPRRELAELPSETRQAVIDYLQVEETETSGGGGPTTPVDAREECVRYAAGYVARNAHGRDLWTYRSQTEWCWADGLITTVPIFTISAEVHAPLWEFAGHVERQETGGHGEASHSDTAEGLFRLCPETPDDCVQDEYVRLVKSQDGIGGYGSETSDIDRSPASTSWEAPLNLVYSLLVYVPLAAAPLIAGRIMRRGSPRGSDAWGLGVIASALGVLVSLYVVLVWVYVGIFSLGSLFGSGSASMSTTMSVERVEVIEVPVAETAVVPVETPAAGGQPGGVAAAPAGSSAEPAPRGDECGDHEVVLRARNLFGQSLWSYESGTWWCWDGVEITNEPRVSTWPMSRVRFWNLVEAKISSVSGGQGHWKHTDSTRIEFQLCIPLLGCVQRDYQWLEKSQSSDGTSVVDELVSQDSYPAALSSLIAPLVAALTLLITGRVLRRGAQRGALAWGFGVIVTSAGSLLLLLIVITSLFFVSASHSVV